MIDTLGEAEIAATILVFQTDRGPGHSLKRMAIKFPLVAMAKGWIWTAILFYGVLSVWGQEIFFYVLVVFRVSVIIQRQLGIKNPPHNDSVRVSMDTEEGMREARDNSLPQVVAGAKLAKAITAEGKDFMEEWRKSTRECNGAVTETFSGLMTGKQVVMVTPHVPKEDVTVLHNKLQKKV